MGNTRRSLLPATRISWESPYASGRFRIWERNPRTYSILLREDVRIQVERLQLLDTFLELGRRLV